MAIKVNTGEQGTYEIIDDNGKLQNSPALTVSHPSASETVVTVFSAPQLLGDVAGFTLGGSPAGLNIEKFPFSIFGSTATDVGDLSRVFDRGEGYNTEADGFSAAGPASGDKIDKFPFAISGGTATEVGTLTLGRGIYAGAHQSTTDGFVSGGFSPSIPGRTSTIDKFPFNISSGTATDVGDLSLALSSLNSHSSSTDGFTTGGSTASVYYRMQKFPFAISGGTAVESPDTGFGGNFEGAGISSTTDAFAAGGKGGGFVRVSTIGKFPFAITSGTITNVGDLTINRGDLAGCQSTSFGFTAGGETHPPAGIPAGLYKVNVIDKFPFSISGGTGVDVGDLTAAIYRVGACQD